MAKKREITSVGTFMSDEWQTPPEWIQRFNDILGGIDLDPCWSDVEGYRFEPFAKTTWGVTDDALAKPVEEWERFRTIYMNCTYSSPGQWAARLAALDGPYWIALTNTQSSARWWHELAAASSVLAFPRRRIPFIDPRTGQPARGNRYDQSIFVKGDIEKAFDILDPYCFVTCGGLQ